MGKRLVAQFSPVIFENINLFGSCLFVLPEAVSDGEVRLLCDLNCGDT